MGGGGKGGDGGAADARKDEQNRQAKIRAGTQRINNIFDGTNGDLVMAKPTGAAVNFADGYYNGDGTPMTGSVKKFDNEIAYTKDPNYDPSAAPKGFTDEYFKKQRQNFIDYATPQLDEQYQDANKQLTFSLARSGLTDSSVRGDKASDLQKLYDLNKQKVADDALGFETSARNSVEDARTGLITTLNATGDAEGAANSALARATALSQPAAYSPLSQLFADFTSGLGTQAAAEKSYSAGGSAPTYTTGLFGTSKNAVKVG